MRVKEEIRISSRKVVGKITKGQGDTGNVFVIESMLNHNLSHDTTITFDELMAFSNDLNEIIKLMLSKKLSAEDINVSDSK